MKKTYRVVMGPGKGTVTVVKCWWNEKNLCVRHKLITDLSGSQDDVLAVLEQIVKAFDQPNLVFGNDARTTVVEQWDGTTE